MTTILRCLDCTAEMVVAARSTRLRCEPCKKKLVVARVAAWRSANPGRQAEQARLRYARDPERHKRICEDWRARNTDRVRDIREARRARERDAFVENVDRRFVWALHEGRCGICRDPVWLEEMHLDHVVPLARGGKHEYPNVQPAHETCNKRKWIKLPEEIA